MSFSLGDWLIVVIYIACVVAIGIVMTRRAGHNIEEFFVSGRNLRWWRRDFMGVPASQIGRGSGYKS